MTAERKPPPTETYVETYIVDAFTEQPFRGNPAGVCLVPELPSNGLMLQIAQELGLSETAFVTPPSTDAAGALRQIRYFSPKMEIPLCGHATLATAQVLLEQGAGSPLLFTNVQALELQAAARDSRVELSFPCYSTQPAEVPVAVLTALGLDSPIDVRYNAETHILMLVMAPSTNLAALAPDFGALRSAHSDINGVLVTAQSERAEFDIESRYFWPWSGTDEDPVTGGTHTFMAPYWADKLQRNRLQSLQCSPRGGSMEVEVSDSTLFIRGSATLVFEGRLRLSEAMLHS